MTRRGLLTSAAAMAGAARPAESYWAVTPERIRRHDDAVDSYAKAQTNSPGSRWHGGLPDATGLHNGGSAAGLVGAFVPALVTKGSRHHRSGDLAGRLKIAFEFLDRHITPDGNINLIFTNFNSPPDTAFAMYSLAGAASIARRAGDRDMERAVEPYVKRCAAGIAKGGVHTPNHRWVMCAALAQAHALYPNDAYVRRVDAWLAETIDIDADGMYSERSTAGYNGVVNRALTVTAVKLNRPELFAPVRRNLESMLYLLHPDYEVVTEISERQDLNTRGNMAGYWLALRTVALREGNGMYETLARRFEPGLNDLLDYPQLTAAGPEPAAVPDDYERQYPALRIARVRRGLTSATMLLNGSSRFFTLRRGGAIVTAVRMASAFFGKGQFRPKEAAKSGDQYVYGQSLEAAYYQPFDRVQPVGVDRWYELRRHREATEVCRLRYEASVKEEKAGFRVRLRASGTADVPVAVELNLGGDGVLEGGSAVEGVADAWLLREGEAVWRVGSDAIRMGPGKAEHRYIQVRGAEPKLPGKSVYVTGFTPFDHEIMLRWG